MPPLTKPEWESVAQFFDLPTTWVLSPAGKDAYAPLFQGTLRDAVAEALKEATYWQTPCTVFHAPGGRSRGDEMLEVAKVSALGPLRKRK